MKDPAAAWCWQPGLAVSTSGASAVVDLGGAVDDVVLELASGLLEEGRGWPRWGSRRWMLVHQLLKGLLAGVAALALAATGVTTASAAPPILVNRGLYAAVGDSFAAGAGNPTLPGADASQRSAFAYPFLLAGSANKRDTATRANSGSPNARILPPSVRTSRCGAGAGLVTQSSFVDRPGMGGWSWQEVTPWLVTPLSVHEWCSPRG